MKLPFTVHTLHILLLARTGGAYTALSDDALKSIPRPGADFNIENGKLLAPILQPRVPGSSGSTAVLNHFAAFFQHELPQWHVAYQNSTSKTPGTGNKDVPFVNFIATRDPPWSNAGEVGYLTLVAHYDSKLTPEGFIGATDSAAPCAMLMHAARSLDDAMTKRWAAMDEMGIKQEDYDLGLEEHKGLQVILLDGEEAFETWTAKDSTYGAKALAAEMEATYHPALSTYHNAISSIQLFLLLDLLGEGSPDPHVPSYFKTTHWAYKSMARLEDRFRQQSLFASSPNHPSKQDSGKMKEKRQEPMWLYDIDKSNDRWMGGLIGDDHEPFMARGVDVLHMIPYPFPLVWHKPTDDGEHLDMNTTEDWAVLVTAFAAEWMDLEGHMKGQEGRKRGEKGGQAGKIISKTEL